MPSEQAPHATQAERALLGAVLLDPDVLDGEEVARLDPSDFYRPDHGRLFARIRAMHTAGQHVDAVTVGASLLEDSEHTDLYADAMRLVDECPSRASAPSYAAEVLDRSERRRALRELAAAMDTIRSDTGVPAGSVVDATSQRLATALGARLDETVVDSLGTLEAAERAQMDPDPGGVPVGLQALADLVPSYYSGSLFVAMARPGMGKTSLVMQVREDCIVSGCGFGLHTIEMTHREIGYRMAAWTGAVTLGDLYRKRVFSDPDLHRRFGQVVDAEARRESWTYVDDRPDQTVTYVESVVRRQVRRWEAAGVRPGVIVVDHLHNMDLSDVRRDNPAARGDQGFAEVTGRLRRLAKRHDVCVLLLCQLNRKVEERADKMPKLSDAREAGSLEQDANVVLGFHRPGKDDEMLPDTEAHWRVLKHREGRTGDARTGWHGEHARFTQVPGKSVLWAGENPEVRL